MPQCYQNSPPERTMFTADSTGSTWPRTPSA